MRAIKWEIHLYKCQDSRHSLSRIILTRSLRALYSLRNCQSLREGRYCMKVIKWEIHSHKYQDEVRPKALAE